jgi:hypothetical protein
MLADSRGEVCGGLDEAPAAPPFEPIERIRACDGEEFRRRFVRASRPVILTGMMEEWPARTRWSLDYFRSRFGDRPVTAGRTRDRTLVLSDRGGIPQVEIPFGEYIDRLSADDCDLYLLSPVAERLPELLADLVPPEVCRTARWSTSRLWIGAPGVRSPLHRDLPDNLYAQVLGRKRFLLIHPRNRGRVYSRPFHSDVPNFSRLDAEAPDLERFPRFRGVPVQVCDVGPGELLFIPRMWWHQVRALETSASVNLWFANGLIALLARASQAYSKLRRLRI